MKSLHPIRIDSGDQPITLGLWLTEAETFSPEEMGALVHQATTYPVVLLGQGPVSQLHQLLREMTQVQPLTPGDTVTWKGITVVMTESGGFERVGVPA